MATQNILNSSGIIVDKYLPFISGGGTQPFLFQQVDDDDDINVDATSVHLNCQNTNLDDATQIGAEMVLTKVSDNAILNLLNPNTISTTLNAGINPTSASFNCFCRIGDDIFVGCDANVTAYCGTTVSTLFSFNVTTGVITNYGGSFSGTPKSVNALWTNGVDIIIIGGEFTAVTGAPNSNGIVGYTYPSGPFFSINNGLEVNAGSRVNSLFQLNSNQLIVGGKFSALNAVSPVATTSCIGILDLGLTQFTAIPSSAGFDFSTDEIFAISGWSDLGNFQIAVGGNFQARGPSTDIDYFIIYDSTVTDWIGDINGNNLDDRVRAIEVFKDTDWYFYVGGDFTDINPNTGTLTYNRLCYYNSTTQQFQGLEEEFDCLAGGVYALKLVDDELYIGGSISACFDEFSGYNLVKYVRDSINNDYRYELCGFLCRPSSTSVIIRVIYEDTSASETTLFISGNRITSYNYGLTTSYFGVGESVFVYKPNNEVRVKFANPFLYNGQPCSQIRLLWKGTGVYINSLPDLTWSASDLNVYPIFDFKISEMT